MRVVSAVAPREFVAFTDCPRRKAWDFHALDLPPDIDPRFRDRPDGDHFRTTVEDLNQIESWGRGDFLVFHRDPQTVWRLDKTTCECVRTCSRCGERWGEK